MNKRIMRKLKNALSAGTAFGAAGVCMVYTDQLRYELIIPALAWLFIWLYANLRGRVSLW